MRRIITVAPTALVLGFMLPAAASSGPVTWGAFTTTPLHAGTATTVSLGGGSTVDVLVNTGGTQGIGAADIGTTGAVATGLDYQHLIVFGIYNGGGAGSVPTTITFSNFHVGSGHVAGYVMVGAANGASSPITVTSSVPVQTWTQAGDTFDLDPNNTSPIFWNPLSGVFTTSAPVGNDSDGIVVRMGSLAQYGTVTISLQQPLDDGVDFSIGEEVASTTGAPGPPSGVSWGRIKSLMR
ncbi:MAG: hypothetical protein U0167_02960 [bacterium]